MKLHLVTIGKPKLAYAQAGWDEYVKRLGRFHDVRTTHLADKYADDAARIEQAAANAYRIALVIEGGRQYTSPALADFLLQKAQDGRELCFLIGGPNGLPPQVIDQADLKWSFGDLTYPHDLAMVILAEALYRASTIGAGHPYHRD
jgi:23S rRNA (pseudouridine1915-N3)-methyltransferase